MNTQDRMDLSLDVSDQITKRLKDQYLTFKEGYQPSPPSVSMGTTAPSVGPSAAFSAPSCPDRVSMSGSCSTTSEGSTMQGVVDFLLLDIALVAPEVEL